MEQPSASIAKGVLELMNPRPPARPMLNEIILGVAFVFEGVSWVVAVKKIAREAKKGRFFKTVIHNKDPSVISVFLEDSAALVGLVIAFLATVIGQKTGSGYADGIASILIGLMLALVSVMMARLTRRLLIGITADRELVEELEQIIENDEAVDAVGDLKTMHLGPEEILLAVDVAFKKQLTVPELERAIQRLEDKLKAREKQLRRIFIEVHGVKGTPGHLEPSHP